MVKDIGPAKIQNITRLHSGITVKILGASCDCVKSCGSQSESLGMGPFHTEVNCNCEDAASIIMEGERNSLKVQRMQAKPDLCSFKEDIFKGLGLLPVSTTTHLYDVKESYRADFGNVDNYAAMDTASERELRAMLDLQPNCQDNPAKIRRKTISSLQIPDCEEGLDICSDYDKVAGCIEKEKICDAICKTQNKKSFLTIEFSSPLGLSVANLMAKEAENFVIEELTYNEGFFRSSTKDSEMIRNRQIPVTFRKHNRRICPKWAHSYKFTTADRKAWNATIRRSDFKKRSQRSRKTLMPCRVALKRLTKAEIDQWTKPKKEPKIDLRRLLMMNSDKIKHLLKTMSLEKSYSIMKDSGNALCQQKNSNTALQEMKYPVALTDVSVRYSTMIQPVIASYPGQMWPILSSLNMSNSTLDSKDVVAEKHGSRPLSLLKHDCANNVNKTSAPNAQINNNDSLDNYFVQHNNPLTDKENIFRNPAIENKANYLDRKLATSNDSHCPTSQSATDPIIIEDDTTDDVIILSSDSAPAKQEAAFIPKQTLLLFNCNLCGEKITYTGSFTNHIEYHFKNKHNVHDIQIIERIDHNGQKVMSIVEKQKQTSVSSNNANHETLNTKEIYMPPKESVTQNSGQIQVKSKQHTTDFHVEMTVKTKAQYVTYTPEYGGYTQGSPNYTQPQLFDPHIICID